MLRIRLFTSSVGEGSERHILLSSTALVFDRRRADNLFHNLFHTSRACDARSHLLLRK